LHGILVADTALIFKLNSKCYNSKMLKKKLGEVKRFFFALPKMNSEIFLASWDEKYGDIHDPLPEEVKLRIEMLMRSFVKPTVCEIGAGYGRIIRLLNKEYKLIAVEPDDLLFKELLQINNLICIKNDISNFKEVEAVDLFFTVRVLEYVSLSQLVSFFRFVKKFQEPALILVYERKSVCKRVRLAQKLTNLKNVYISELIG